MAGIRGFEPLNDGIKTRCLTAWLYPYNVFTLYSIEKWYGSRDLNSHILRYWNLNPARLPIPPNPRNFYILIYPYMTWWLHRDLNLGPHHYE